MKKVLRFLLVLTLVVSLAACGQGPAPQTQEEEAGLYKPGTYTATETGYNTEVPMEVAVTVSKDKIEKIEVTKHEETDGIGSAVIEKMPEKIIEAQSTEVDAFTGATETSKALIAAVNTCLKEALVNAPAETTGGDREVDVVVIGAGGAGMSAAIAASDAGSSVLVLEKNELVGGNTTRATGGLNAAKTPYQDANEMSQGEYDAIAKKLETVKEKYPDLEELAATVEKQVEDYKANPEGYFDSEELFLLDTLVGGKDLNDKELAKTLVSNSKDAIEWLKTFDMDITSVGAFGGASVKRIHRPEVDGKTVPVGSYLVPRLEKVLKDKNIEILFGTPATELLVEEGKVVGVKAGDLTVRAKSVVIATGGFGANLEKVAEIKPELKGFVTTNVASITGDGIWMAQAIGADVVDLDQIQIHPTVEQETASLITEGVRGDGAILVNQDGKRFVDEVGTRDVVSAAEIEQDGGFGYLIFDENMVEKSNVLKKYIEKGFTTQGETYEELAKALGISEENFKATMETWNQAVANKKDDEFGRTAFTEPLAKAPYYAIKVSPGVHHTMGGVKINPNGEVIGTDGNVIKNLFAAGEVTGGVHGGNRLGGNAVTDIIVFGRIAGENAAKNAK